MTSIFEDQPHQNKAEIPIKTRVINGFQVYIDTDSKYMWACGTVCIYGTSMDQLGSMPVNGPSGRRLEFMEMLKLEDFHSGRSTLTFATIHESYNTHT